MRTLDDVAVLDLSGPLGAYGSKLLAALGAHVTAVELPDGSPLATWGPMQRGTSLPYRYYSYGKRIVRQDWTRPSAAARLAELARDADVILVAPTPDTPVAGLEGCALSWAPAGAIVICLTHFGLDGPWAQLRSTPLVSYALSGLHWKLGDPEQPPPPPPTQQIYDQLALHACTAALVGLRERPVTGGQFVELSLHEVLAAQDGQVSRYARRARFLTRRHMRLGAPPSGIWACKDSEVELTVHNPAHWHGFLAVVDHPADLRAPELADRSERYRREDWLAARVASLLERLTVAELVDRCQEQRVPCAPRYSPAEFVDDSQSAQRALWAKFVDTDGARFRAPRLPFVSTPDLAEPVETWDHSAAAKRMSQLRVLSFGQAIAGNVTASLLAELGADVVKIEAAARPDPNRVRMYEDEPRVLEPGGHETNSFFATFSRSVQSIDLDMRDEADRGRFLALLAQADVLIENFGGGVMARWGFDVDRLMAVNPQLVYLSISGYGRTGPRAPAAAYGSTIHNYIGLARAWVNHGTHLDYAAVAAAVPTVLAALRWRDRTGRGAYVDLAQSEAAVAMTAPLYLGPLNGLPTPDFGHGGSPACVLAGVFRCAGDQAWVAVEVRDQRDANAVADVVGLSDESGVGPTPGTDLRPALDAWCAELTPHQAMFQLQRVGVPAGAVRSGEELFLDPQHAARGLYQQIEHPDLGRLVEPGPPFRMSGTSVRIRRPSPRVGEHTAAVFERWLKRS